MAFMSNVAAGAVRFTPKVPVDVILNRSVAVVVCPVWNVRLVRRFPAEVPVSIVDIICAIVRVAAESRAWNLIVPRTNELPFIAGVSAVPDE